MNRYCIQYHSRTLVSLAGRKEQQIFPLPGWEVNFPNFELRIALSDNVKKTTDINLHTGLNIVCDLRANSVEEARESSKNFAETILNLISFSTLAYCDQAKLLSITNIGDKETHPSRYYVYPFAGQEIIGSLSIIGETLFGTIFEAYDKSFHQQRTLRALTWLRKGIGEENTVDEFISYWVGLEVLKPVLRRNLRRKIRNPREWAGVEDIFTRKLHFQNFDAIKREARNGLLHGFRELDDNFVKEIDGYVEPIRKTLIYCIGSILGLEDNITLAIANKTPRRITQDPWTVIEGDLRDLPRDFSELVKNYPMIDAEIVNKEFSIDQSGELSMKFTVNHHFHGPSDTKWDIKAKELWGDKDAGIRRVDIR